MSLFLFLVVSYSPNSSNFVFGLRLTIAPDDNATWPVGLALTILVLHAILFALATIVGLANDGGVLVIKQLVLELIASLILGLAIAGTAKPPGASRSPA